MKEHIMKYNEYSVSKANGYRQNNNYKNELFNLNNIEAIIWAKFHIYLLTLKNIKNKILLIF